MIIGEVDIFVPRAKMAPLFFSELAVVVTFKAVF